MRLCVCVCVWRGRGGGGAGAEAHVGGARAGLGDRLLLTHPPLPPPPPQELHPSLALVFDGGRLAAGRSGSTILDLTRPGEFSVARRGSGFAEAVQLLAGKYGLRHLI